MKNTSKNIDVLASVKKSPRYFDLAQNAEWKIRFAVEVYNSRTEKGISQQALAKKIGSTQRVISNIENGDVDMRASMINRLALALNFSIENWSRVYKFELPTVTINTRLKERNKVLARTKK